MKRREFLAGIAAAGAAAATRFPLRAEESAPACCGRTYASPAEAMRAPRETLLYVPCLYAGTKVNAPDYLATVDVDPQSGTYGKVIHRAEMPNVGDELHHFGWNACSSCHGDPTKARRYLIVPGLTSSRIHILDGSDPRSPRMHHVIEGKEIAEKTNLSAPHTVHCLADGQIMISMLGDAEGRAPGGFLLLDDEFQIVGRWERGDRKMLFNYDYWYQPRHNVMVSSEWAAPNTIKPGFDPKEVEKGKYGQRVNFWNWKERTLSESFDMGSEGYIPLEVRFHHNPDSTHGFVGAALSSAIWHWHRPRDRWEVAKVVQVDPVEKEGWPFPVPGLITDLLISMDDRWLYFSNWLHGDVRQYDISDPLHPKLAGRLWLGGVLGKGRKVGDKSFAGGPQMLQLSLDGKRLYVTNSLYSSWDNQFYPEMAEQGSDLVQVDCDTERGGLALNERLHVDFGKEPSGPARAHEMRFPDGDCTSDIWI
ncbi:MAG: selenium-binding family protein [Planctomycetota bacterium]